jgi:regulator of protease activity HflC (stomatin/prohibitin superfamily)
MGELFAAFGLLGVLAVLFFIGVVILSAIRVVQEYERGVVYRLGRYVGLRGPGLILLLPFIERMRIVDMRTITLDVPPQEVITRDNVTIKVNAVLYFRVVNPADAVNRILDYHRATSQIAQTTLRSTLGQSELDELLSKRDEINAVLQRIIDEQTESWGIKVSAVEVKDLELPQLMQRAMAKQAEAEREKRAKIIHAQGELQASQTLADAAEIMAASPTTLQLRYLQTLTEVSAERNSTVIFPVPLDIISAFIPGLKELSQPASPPRPKPAVAAPQPGIAAPPAQIPPRPQG